MFRVEFTLLCCNGCKAQPYGTIAVPDRLILAEQVTGYVTGVPVCGCIRAATVMHFCEDGLMMNIYRLKLFLLYFLLGAGGLWHILSVFDSPMRLLAAPMIFGIGLWLAYEYWQYYALPMLIKTVPPGVQRRNFVLWSLFVILGSIAVESVGVQSGVLFGHYTYGSALPPYIGPVPVVIGFAWLGMLLSSVAVVTRSTPRSLRLNNFAGALMVALFMMIFDVVMEPAATALGYWHWTDGSIPVQNYIAWFIVSFVFAFAGFSLRLFEGRTPLIALHAYFAQLLYFLLVTFGKA